MSTGETQMPRPDSILARLVYTHIILTQLSKDQDSWVLFSFVALDHNETYITSLYICTHLVAHWKFNVLGIF